jgi:excinuclease ABC subunit B
MQKAIDDTRYRRNKQQQYNTDNNVVPMALNKKIDNIFTKVKLVDQELGASIIKAAEKEAEYLTKPEIENASATSAKRWKKRQRPTLCRLRACVMK